MPVLGILDGIVQTFELATQTWFTTLFPIAQNLFFALMVIQIAWVGIWSTLGRHEGGEQVLVHILRQVFVLSILYTVLVFSPIWVPTVIGSFEQAGAAAGGIDGINPSSVFSGGFLLALGLLDGLNRELGKTIIMVTHDPKAAGKARRIIHLEKGVLVD